MRKNILFVLMLFFSLAVSAKEWPISLGTFKNYSINIPDEYECVYNGDTAKSNPRYVFALPEQVELYLRVVEIDNLNVTNAKAAPDTLIFPGLKTEEVLSSENTEEGLLSRIITIRHKDKTTSRLYLYVVSEGFITMEAISKSNNYDQIDTIARTMDSNSGWLVFALWFGFMIGGGIIFYFLGFLIVSAWDNRKDNPQKALLYLLAFIVILIAASFLGLLIGISYWKAFLILLIIGIIAAICIINGIFII